MERLFRIFFCFCLAGVLSAHPMGNFSVNHYSRFEVSSDGLKLHYVLDLAEIPTFELMREWNASAEAQERQAHQQAGIWARNLRLSRDGRAFAPRLVASKLVISDGAGGLPVMHIAADFQIPLVPGVLEFEDRNYEGRAGWKEIVIATQPGAALVRTTHSDTDRSQGLTAYPQDPTIAPPQDLRAAFEWRAPGPLTTVPPVAPRTEPLKLRAPAPQQPGAVVRGDFLSTLLGRREIPLTLVLAGIAVAFGLGAMHALSPGHGKTLVAAYLIGSRGTLRHAVILGALVTFTHTISVFALGLVTLFLSQYVVPEKIYPVLGAISGLSIVYLGGSLLIRRLYNAQHGHSHDHHHHDHGHGHAHHHHHDHGSLIALGASGGLVPCPSALVILLSAVALGRTGLGLLLLIGFSLGLSMVLIAIGTLVVYARHLLPDRGRLAASPLFRLIPVFSAAVILCVGLVMTSVSLGWPAVARMSQ